MLHRLLSLLVLFLTVSPAFCDDPKTRSMSLNDCIEMALEHNLGLRVARYGPSVASNNLSMAYSGYDPTLGLSGQRNSSRSPGGLDSDQRIIPPSESTSDQFSADVGGLLPWGMTYDLSGNIRDTTIQTGLLPGETSQGSIQGSITQPLLKNSWIDDTRMTIAVSKRDLAISKQTERQNIIDTVTSVEDGYYNLIAARENVKVQQDALLLAQKLLDENRKRVEVGAMAPLDQQEAEAEVAAREADLLEVQKNLAIQQNNFKGLITDDYLAWNGTEVVPSEELKAQVQLFDLQDSWDKGLTMRPDMIQNWLTLEQRGIQVKFAKNQLLPQLDAFATYGQSGSDKEFSGLFTDLTAGSQPFWTAGARLRFPLSNTRARANYRNARAQLETMVLNAKAAEQGVMAEIENAVKTAQASYRQVGATRVAREFREAALQAEQERLANGKSTSFLVLQRQRDLTTARSAEIAALVAYNQALADLAKSEGSTLQRHNIDFEEQ